MAQDKLLARPMFFAAETMMSTPETDQDTPIPAAPMTLVAHIEERILAPLRRNPRATRWFAFTLVAILALHGAVLAYLFYRDPADQKVAAAEPPAVEVIVEKPKEEPKPPPEKKPEPPKPQPKQEVEKPASSAPRAPSETKVETASLDKETRAPKAPVPLQDGQKEPEKDASSPSTEPAEKEKLEEPAAAKPDVLQKDAEALDKAKPQPKKTEKKVAKLQPKAKVRKAKTALQQLAGASELPDYKFARPTKKSPVYGGSEDSRYLAIVYGMIMQHRSRVGVPGGGGGNVTIAFNVDDEGNLVGLGVQTSSGYPEIDREAAAAIRRSSPFPPPPAGAPHGLVATVNFGESEAVYTSDSDR